MLIIDQIRKQKPRNDDLGPFRRITLKTSRVFCLNPTGSFHFALPGKISYKFTRHGMSLNCEQNFIVVVAAAVCFFYLKPTVPQTLLVGQTVV